MSDALADLGLLDAGGAGFLRRGHFVFESGDHGDAWLEVERLFTAPRRMERAAAALADKLRAHRPDLVCGPAIGGALVGQWVAAALDVPFVYAERHVTVDGVQYVVPPGVRSEVSGVRAAIVDDVVNAGAAAVATARALRSLEATVVALGVLVARASSVLPIVTFAGMPVESLATLDWNLWPVASCPLCAAGAPVTTPD
jgi:orotate phosphoribosyltransferase